MKRLTFLEVTVLSLCAGVAIGVPLKRRLTYEQLTGDDILYGPSNQRNAKKEGGQWPHAVIPYVFDQKLPSNRMTAITEAITAYRRHTCVRFVPKVNHSDYIRIMDGGYGRCYSFVGRRGGAQDISIGYGCDEVGIVIHEIAHALGFFHEHGRPDRDDFVTIKFDEITPSRKYNFEKRPPSAVDLYGLGYDYLSVMHYGKNYFSLTGEDTIVTKDTKYQEKIGNRKYFSSCDLEKINRRYNCTGFISSRSPCELSPAHSDYADMRQP